MFTRFQSLELSGLVYGSKEAGYFRFAVPGSSSGQPGAGVIHSMFSSNEVCNAEMSPLEIRVELLAISTLFVHPLPWARFAANIYPQVQGAAAVPTTFDSAWDLR